MTNIRDCFVSRNYLNKTKFCHLMSDVSSVHGLVTLFNNSAESLLLQPESANKEMTDCHVFLQDFFTDNYRLGKLFLQPLFFGWLACLQHVNMIIHITAVGHIVLMFKSVSCFNKEFFISKCDKNSKYFFHES